MKIRDVSHSTSTPRQRAVYLDPFDPVRRGPVSRPGQRGAVLTRRERREREETARFTQLAVERRVHEESQWAAELAAQGRIRMHARRHVNDPEAVLPGWPVPLNRTGSVVDSVVRLWAGILNNHTRSLSALDMPVSDEASQGAPATPASRPVSAPAGVALADPVAVSPEGMPGSPAATAPSSACGRLSVGETVVLGWLRQGCGAMMEIARRVRGANWTALHTTIASYTLPSCTITLDRHGNEVSPAALALSGETGREFRLVHQVLPPGLEPGAMWLRPLGVAALAAGLVELATVTRTSAAADTGETALADGPADSGPALTASAMTDETGAARAPQVMEDPVPDQAHDGSLERGGRIARMLGMRSPFEYMAVNTVRLNFPKEDRAALVEGGKQVAAKLGDFLQAPCQTMSQTVAEASNKPVGTGERLGTGACDIVYGLTPPGAILSTGGGLLNMATRIAQPHNATQEDAQRAIDTLTFMPRAHGVVQTRGRPAIWDGRDFQKFEATHPDRGLLVDDSPARPGVARMPGVLIELGEQGWQIAAVPEAYRVVSDDATLASDPDRIMQTSPRHGYVRIDEALYEVHRDATTTRWRIVPPDDAQGVTIAVEHVARERRWQTVTLLGAGDPPPLIERYDVRDAVLRGGPEGDVYADAHAEEYNEDLLPPGVADRPVDQLMSEFVDSTRSPRELGALHHYIEVRRDEAMMAQLLTQVRER